MPRPLRPELRDELLESAARDFARQGYGATSLDRIGQGLGVTKGAIYFHFRGKLELFFEALKLLEGRRAARLAEAREQLERGGVADARSTTSAGPAAPRAAGGGHASPRAALAELRAMLLGRLVFYAEHPELRRLHQILDEELADAPAAAARDGLRADYRALRAELRSLLQQAARAGAELTDPATEAFRLAACLEGTIAQIEASPDDSAPFWAPEYIVDGWLAPLRPRRRRPSAAAVSDEQPERRDDDADFQPAF